MRRIRAHIDSAAANMNVQQSELKKMKLKSFLIQYSAFCFPRDRVLSEL